jgi:hypothetical protein
VTEGPSDGLDPALPSFLVLAPRVFGVTKPLSSVIVLAHLMTKAVITGILIFVAAYLAGQQYHYSSVYEADTAAYEAKKRALLEIYTSEYRKGVRFVPNKTHEYRSKGWLVSPGPLTPFEFSVSAVTSAGNIAESRGQNWFIVCAGSHSGLQFYENDTLRCVYAVPCTGEESDCQRKVISKREHYRNGSPSTNGDFLVISCSDKQFTFPINRHVLYRKSGSLRSIATFDTYGRPLNDSLFDNKGRFKEVREININEVVQVK